MIKERGGVYGWRKVSYNTTIRGEPKRGEMVKGGLFNIRLKEEHDCIKKKKKVLEGTLVTRRLPIFWGSGIGLFVGKEFGDY